MFSNTITPPLLHKLTRQQSDALLNVPCVSPGTWLTTPCLNPLNRFNHHFIAIHPLLYIGYNGREINMVNLWGDIEQGQAKKYVTKKWKVVREPKSSQHAALIITRAISRLNEHKYNGLINNCEHYVTWCYTGYSKSNQVEESVLNGLSSGSTAICGAGIGVLCGSTLCGSTQLGTAAVVVGAVTAPVTWPYIVGGAAIGSLVGYGIPKCMEINRKRKKRKKLKEKLIYRSHHYSIEMILEVEQIINMINTIVDDDNVDKKDLGVVNIALNDLFYILDKYYYRNRYKDDKDNDMDKDKVNKMELTPLKGTNDEKFEQKDDGNN